MLRCLKLISKRKYFPTTGNPVDVLPSARLADIFLGPDHVADILLSRLSALLAFLDFSHATRAVKRRFAIARNDKEGWVLELWVHSGRPLSEQMNNPRPLLQKVENQVLK